MKDIHLHYLQEAANDKYEDRNYNGLFIFLLDGKSYAAKMRWIREGGMREFYDPVTGNYLGCCGCNVPIESIFEFINKYLFQDRPNTKNA